MFIRGIKMKIRKKEQNKQENNSEIKIKYLTKLTKELVSEGFSNEEVNKIISEISASVDQYLLDNKISSSDELERNFGEPRFIREEYREHTSKQGVQIQKIAMFLGLFALLIVPSFIVSSYFISPIWEILSHNTYNYLEYAFDLFHRDGYIPVTAIFSSGYGLFGLFIGLNVYLTLLLKTSKNRLPIHDPRRKIIPVILIEYWLLVLNWLVLFLLSFLIKKQWFSYAWENGLGGIIIEFIIRWSLVGIFLIITAVYYTLRNKNRRGISSRFSDETTKVDINSFVLIFTILTGFVLPSLGFGMVIIVIGLYLILSGRISGKIWFLGLGSLILQLSNFIELSTVMINKSLYPRYHITQIIFGIPFRKTLFDIEGPILISYFMISIVLLAWIVIGYISIRRSGRKLLPQFRVKGLLKKWYAILLLFLVIVATLSSRPHPTIRFRESVHFNEDNLATSEITFYIPKAGNVYIQVYGLNGSCTWDLYAFSATKTYEHWNGTLSEEEFLCASNYGLARFMGRTIKFNAEEPIYLLLTCERPVPLDTLPEGTPNNLPLTGLSIDVQWRATVAWFPYWTDLLVIILTAFSLFLEWPISEDIKKQKNLFQKKEAEPTEHT